MTFEELYKLLAKKAVAGELDKLDKSISQGERHNLDCLINGGKAPLIINQNQSNCNCQEHTCLSACLFDAIEVVDGKIKISADKCVGCGACIDVCGEKKLTASKDLIEVIAKLKSDKKIYALLAPAIVGQFGDNVSLGKIRTALKLIGFDGVVEVATFADILTLREAIEFAHRNGSEGNYQLTSCCCPVWIALIKKNFDKLSTHLTPAVSPMIAAGRCVKKIAPDCLTVFISPCLAKRAEAREPDLLGAIDNVITFQELRDLFDLLEIDLEGCVDDEKDHSSFAGRIYAVSGGVSKAVEQSYIRMMENQEAEIVHCKIANGINECRAMLNDILAGKIEANFYEGMGCNGGCVAGAKVIKDKSETTLKVKEFAEQSKYHVPIDNPYVVKILSELGMEKIGDLISDDEIFCRKSLS